MQRLRFVPVALLACVSVVVVGCGDDEEGDTGPESSTTSLVTPLPVEVTENVRYHADVDGYREPLLDIVAPREGGPWPVVVMWHEGGGLFEDKDQWDQLSPLVAEQGAVVITPTYGTLAPTDYSSVEVDPDYPDVVGDERACVLAFVTERAGDYGGNSDDLIAFGSSAGASYMAGPSVWDDNEVGEGCAVDAEPARPRTLALNEGDLMLSATWDAALVSGAVDFEEMTVWDSLDRSAGTDIWLLQGGEESTQHRLSVGDPYADDECGRTIEPGTGVDLPGDGECVWWQLRDPDNSFRQDAERLGLFDDGWFHVGEESLILADRLTDLGQDPEIIVIDGLSHGIRPDETILLAPALIDIVRT